MLSNIFLAFVSSCFLWILTPSTLSAQDNWYDREDAYEDTDTTKFFVGVNIGAHFANNNSAVVYNGSPQITSFGIQHIIFEQQFNKQFFDNFFGPNSYSIKEYPFEPRYRTSVEFGIHFGYRITRRIAVFTEVNITQLEYEQFFTVEKDTPSNSLQDDLVQVPLFGEENRFNLNLGTQISFFKGEASSAYAAVFGNLNSIQMQRNYFVVDNREFEIFHESDNPNQSRLGGTAMGTGGGLGFKFDLSDNLMADLNYNLYYLETNLGEGYRFTGTHHTLGLRILWKK